jgi:hypothetical protein
MKTTARRASAVFSEDRVYRYRLDRRWDTATLATAARTLNIIGLNPSTADEREDDPTIRRCISFAKAWGFGSLVMTNLYALRGTDPFVLRLQKASGRDIVGPENDHHLLKAAREANRVVLAWGTHGTLLDRDTRVIQMLAPHVELWCFGVTYAGHPRHPLYLRRDTEAVLWT